MDLTCYIGGLGRTVTAAATFDSSSIERWRRNARACLERDIRPSDVAWRDDGTASLLFGDTVAADGSIQSKRSVPGSFVLLATTVSCHRDESRWSMLYTLLWRLTHGEPHLMQIASDPLVSSLIRMHRAVRRASHKMKAFVRFKSFASESGDEEFIAWFEPAHGVVELTAPFFVNRFRSMRWSILTPDGCARWDTQSLALTRGVERHEVPSGDDALESLWRTYYANIFNPSRLNIDAMRAEMPKRYWKNLPEAALIGDLTRNAPSRMANMIAQTFRAPEPMPLDLDAIESAGPRVDSTEPFMGSDHIAWDPIYDPGWREARRRAEAVTSTAPGGIHRGETRIVAGVAGWTDPTLLARGVFYPDDATSAEARLRHYASHLPMVEVDATYYTFPSFDTSSRWVERTPSNFVFNIKAHSLMTGHPTDPARLPKWLTEDLPLRLRAGSNVYSHHFSTEALDEVWRRFLSALEPLRESGKLGAIMLQYPRWFKPARAAAADLNLARQRLNDWPATVEFRHREWLVDRVRKRAFGLLRELEFSYVAVDSPPGMESSVPPEMEVTNPRLAMFRFHGRRTETWERHNDEVAERYRYLYDKAQLRGWLPVIERAIDEAMNVHLTFNNNKWNYAVANAIETNEMLLTAG